MLWVRHMEVVAGIACLAFAVQLWSLGWWHWVFIGIGVLNLSPWPGVRMILRKANPEVWVLRLPQQSSVAWASI